MTLCLHFPRLGIKDLYHHCLVSVLERIKLACVSHPSTTIPDTTVRLGHFPVDFWHLVLSMPTISCSHIHGDLLTEGVHISAGHYARYLGSRSALTLSRLQCTHRNSNFENQTLSSN